MLSQEFRILARQMLRANKRRDARHWLEAAQRHAETAKDSYENARLWLRLGRHYRKQALACLRQAQRAVRDRVRQEGQRHRWELSQIRADWQNCTHVWRMFGGPNGKHLAELCRGKSAAVPEDNRQTSTT